MVEEAIGGLVNEGKNVMVILDGVDFLMAALEEGAGEIMEMIGGIRKVGFFAFHFSCFDYHSVVRVDLFVSLFVFSRMVVRRTQYHEKNLEKGESKTNPSNHLLLLFPASSFPHRHYLGRRPAAAFSQLPVGNQPRGPRCGVRAPSSSGH